MSKDTLVNVRDKLWVGYMFSASTYGVQKRAGLHVATWYSMFMIHIV